MNNPRRVLIVKTGFSEFLDRGISTTVSLGDILFCTSILHLYKDDHVIWVTAWRARHLLKDNPYIKELLIFGPAAFRKLREESFDILVNLEKDIGICSYLDQIQAEKRYGFYFNENSHNILTYRRSTRYLLDGQESHKNINKNSFEILYESVGKKWNGQGAILARKKHKKVQYDIGLNFEVGTKWPTKAWPKHNWKILEKLLRPKHSVSWQQGFKNIKTYIDWIDSCKVVVTSDSLGQMISQAFGKKVVVLYGPTNYRRAVGVSNINIVRSTLKCPYLPCYLPICKYREFCMDYISPERVARECERLLK